MSERRLSRSRELATDERGAVVVIALFMAVALVGMLWYVMGAGDAIVYRETMQDGADATAFASAVYHARGMNFVAMLNIIMAALVAIMLVVKLAALIINLAVDWTIIGAAAGVTANRVSAAVSKVIDVAVNGLLVAQEGVAVTMPWLAFAKSLTVPSSYAPIVQAGGAVSVSMFPTATVTSNSPAPPAGSSSPQPTPPKPGQPGASGPAPGGPGFGTGFGVGLGLGLTQNQETRRELDAPISTSPASPTPARTMPARSTLVKYSPQRAPAGPPAGSGNPAPPTEGGGTSPPSNGISVSGRVGLPLAPAADPLCKAGFQEVYYLLDSVVSRFVGSWAMKIIGDFQSDIQSFLGNLGACDGLKSLDVYPPAVAGSDYYGVYSLVYGNLGNGTSPGPGGYTSYANKGVDIATWGRTSASDPALATHVSFAKAEFYFDLGYGMFTFQSNPSGTTPQTFPADGAWNMRWRARLRRVRAVPELAAIIMPLLPQNFATGMKASGATSQNLDNQIQALIGPYLTLGIH